MYTIRYNNGYQTWEGKTYDDMINIIRKGYATIRAADGYLSSKGEYDHNNNGPVIEVPLHQIIQVATK